MDKSFSSGIPAKLKMRHSIFEWPSRTTLKKEIEVATYDSKSCNNENNFVPTKCSDVYLHNSVNSLPEVSSSDLRKKVFKTKLSLDFSKISRRNTENKSLPKITEENNSIVFENGHVVLLRVSSTSSTRSFRGEVHKARANSSSSGSLGSPGNYSIPSTPDSPTPDIDSAFAQKQKVTKDSPDTMSDLKELARKLHFTPEQKDDPSQIWQRISKFQTEMEQYSPCVVEDSETDDESICLELTDEIRKENLQRSVDWLREELLTMKQQDQDIARQLISIRLEIQRLRLQHSIVTNKAILEDVAQDADDERAFPYNHCELPEYLRLPGQVPAHLRHLGLTKLNISNRRFSLR